MKIPNQIFSQAKPFFLFSENEIHESVGTVREFWKNWSLPGFELYFSIKVNPNPHLLKVIFPLVDGFDVSSLVEARLARKVSQSAARLTWSGPAKTDQAMDEILGWGLRCLHLDSFDEWSRVQKRKSLWAPETQFSLRLSNGEIHSQKLGFSQAELERLKELSFEKYNAVHSYLGRETFSPEVMSAFMKRLSSSIQNGTFSNQPEIFLGAGLPGHKILQNHMIELKPSQAPDRIIHLESGRGLIQSAGWYGTQVLSLKKSKSQFNVIIDGGLQHLASHLLSPKYKAESVELRFFRDGQELLDRSLTISVMGSLSLWHDTMIENITAPADLKRGDWVLANNVGAYGYSSASNQFLGPSPIREWLLRRDQSLVDISANNLISYQEALP